ncbi:MAG: alkaline phosphatase D family protein [Pseudomonadota bacterium]
MTPVLFLHDIGPDSVTLAALAVHPSGERPGPLTTATQQVEPQELVKRGDRTAFRYVFTMPLAADTWYEVAGARYSVDTDYRADLRIAYVSCNGQEHEDTAREETERNIMWRRLGAQHDKRPFQLLLHGGDQIYADEVVSAHPASAGWPSDIAPTLSESERAALYDALREAFFTRYADQYAQEDFAQVAARVPSIAMWDDHDICDGWGSLAPEILDSDVGVTLFAAARECFLLFQAATGPGDLPPLCNDRTGRSLSLSLTLPGVAILAPDLRSERRPDRIMDTVGWSTFKDALGKVEGGHVLILSSVPALGPRLSLLERLIPFVPKLRKYEDDLRDQWQSLAHRDEWRAFLSALLALHEQDGIDVTVVSGEIHLATHATMATASGDLHQLVASGITHPAPPRVYARGLGAFAALGEAPLAGHPITIRGLPGHTRRYCAERNFLVLERREGRWSATWDLEESGRTPALSLSA